MEIYDTEEEQIAALKRWWADNGKSTITGIVLGITCIVAWNFWQSYKTEQGYGASTMYEELLGAVNSDKLESAEKLAEALQQKYGSTAYAQYATLMRAKIQVKAGDLDAAKAILSQLAKEANSEISHVATIRLVRLMLATGEYEQGLQKIAEVDQSTAQDFSGSYDELTGDLYVALDRIAEARTAYQKALRSGHVSPLLQFKIDDLTSAEIEESQN